MTLKPISVGTRTPKHATEFLCHFVSSLPLNHPVQGPPRALLQYPSSGGKYENYSYLKHLECKNVKL